MSASIAAAISAAAPGAQGEFVAAFPERFFVPPYVGHLGWLSMRVRGPLDGAEAERIGLVSLCWMCGYLLSPFTTERPLWHRQALPPFLLAGTFETLGIVLVIAALSVGQVVLVSPIVATSPLWILLGTRLFLRGIEALTLRTVIGAVCVVSGTIAIALVR